MTPYLLCFPWGQIVQDYQQDPDNKDFCRCTIIIEMFTKTIIQNEMCWNIVLQEY